MAITNRFDVIGDASLSYPQLLCYLIARHTLTPQLPGMLAVLFNEAAL
jgi:hypothetical protein